MRVTNSTSIAARSTPPRSPLYAPFPFIFSSDSFFLLFYSCWTTRRRRPRCCGHRSCRAFVRTRTARPFVRRGLLCIWWLIECVCRSPRRQVAASPARQPQSQAHLTGICTWFRRGGLLYSVYSISEIKRDYRKELQGNGRKECERQEKGKNKKQGARRARHAFSGGPLAQPRPPP